MTKFIYRGDNASFNGRVYIKDGAEFFDEKHGKLQPLEEGEVSRAYFAGAYIVAPQTTSAKPIVANDGYIYGTRAISVYDEMCERFGWRKGMRGYFAPRQPLYANPATKEGYAVLFLAHSNWTATEGGVWRNTIFYLNKIEESWPIDVFNSPKYYHSKDEVRVTFAQNGTGYVFIGAYKVDHWEEKYDPYFKTNRMIKTYKLLSNTYPF